MKSRSKHSKLLGIAVGDKSMLVAEVTSSGGYAVTRLGQFHYPSGQSLAVPETLGQGLSQFLKSNGFTARKAVFGMPAKWVLTKAKEVPAADEATIASALRIQAEGDFSPELKDLVYDFAGSGNTKQSSTVLLLATPKRNIDQINTIADAAKIDVVAITVSMSALAAATARVRKDSLVLALGPGGTELGAQPTEGASILRHVGPASASAAPMLLGEIRRATAALDNSGNGNGFGLGNGHAKRQVILWDDAEGAESATALAACRTMGETAGLAVVDGELSLLGVTPSQSTAKGAATAVALALEGLQGRLPVDFLDTRLAPPKEQKYDPKIVYGVAAAAILLLAIIGGWWDLHNLQAQADAKNRLLASENTRLIPIKAETDRISQVRQWHTEVPKLVSCLSELTRAFPPERDLFVVGLSLRQDAKGDVNGMIQGRVSAGITAPVFTLYNRLLASSHFSGLSGDSRGSIDGKDAMYQIMFYYQQDSAQPAPTGTAPRTVRASRR